ncbi:MAG: hypothetical protein HYS12_24130 [Planctomycetes bacterium]|nr:hypothetical protein [Planctomycetota bacterium]
MCTPSTRFLPAAALLLAAVAALPAKDDTGITVDKKDRSVSIACAVAPRKLPTLDQIYPIEVIATFPAPKGQKAHETVVTYQAKPSDVHKALESLDLKPGKPAQGEGAVGKGPEVEIFLEVPTSSGKVKRIPIEEAMIDTKSGKPVPRLKWHFTGSALKQPDPEKDDKVYGADLTGTLITVFPVTDDCVVQSGLAFKDQDKLKLEVNKKLVPKEGTLLKLVIKVK